MNSAPQGALLLVDLPEQSPEYFDGIAQRHGKTGAELAAMLGRSGSPQALRNAWSRIKTGKHPLSPLEHAGLLLSLGEHPAYKLEPR
jgi:hypothetical protein